ncbi:hypothetical protein B0A62_22730 [Flavobacterium hydatis]|uniref:Uncharacterized protein n=1 Tax=Flavobacterium hydatis TaxID=991 RepID=A0A086ALF5_FLAHY|nr:hypothetical protein IW20_07410 [Flavobacterium hydatis]OXA87599.1 hypothetical protein B0A62_22730 [Flavobacterium hydatis]
MFGWANIQNQILFVGVFGWEIFFFDFGREFGRFGSVIFLLLLKKIKSYFSKAILVKKIIF